MGRSLRGRLFSDVSLDGDIVKNLQFNNVLQNDNGFYFIIVPGRSQLGKTIIHYRRRIPLCVSFYVCGLGQTRLDMHREYGQDETDTARILQPPVSRGLQDL